jgi:hypothetical protein
MNREIAGVQVVSLPNRNNGTVKVPGLRLGSVSFLLHSACLFSWFLAEFVLEHASAIADFL